MASLTLDVAESIGNICSDISKPIDNQHNIVGVVF